jgi:hypothetical protein
MVVAASCLIFHLTINERFHYLLCAIQKKALPEKDRALQEQEIVDLH